VSLASPVACDGQPVDFQLPIAAAVDITWRTGAGSEGGPGTTTTTNTPQPFIDNVYLPGLKDQAAPETAPVSSTGHQIIAQLGQGIIRIDGSAPFTCSGPAVAGIDDSNTWYVTVPAAVITSVTCTIS
jgi:hypothetical protein